MSSATILLVDDEPSLCIAIRQFFENYEYEVLEAGDCQTALEVLRRSCPDVVLLDHSLPDGNSLTLMQRIRNLHPDAPIIILTAHGSIDLAVQAMKEGAEHFLTKPLHLDILRTILERALENQRVRQKARISDTRPNQGVDPFLGSSNAIRQLARVARRASETDYTVLIQGETGTGKGVLAAWLHRNGLRANRPFVDVNCAGLSRELLESELFGYEKGAFTGAVNAKTGLFEAAHRGSIFLDEIGDAEMPVQAKLLKVLEENRFRRLGDVRERQVDVRMIAATHHDLRQGVNEQKFRSDLYFRISVVTLDMPPLRRRVEDIPELAAYLLQDVSRNLGHDIGISRRATETLQSYSWPGNIRELRNVLHRALLVTEGNVLEPCDLLFEQKSPGAASIGSTVEKVTEVERQHIMKVLGEESGHIPNAAKRLGIPRSSLYKKVKKLGISLPKDRR